jgi:hypothetical protein
VIADLEGGRGQRLGGKRNLWPQPPAPPDLKLCTVVLVSATRTACFQWSVWMLRRWSSAETIFSDRAVASCPHAIVVSPLLMARAPSIAHAQPAVRTLVGGPESASSKAASLATAAATQPLAPSSAPATLPAPMRLPFCAPSYLLLGLPDPAPLAPCSSHGRWSHSDAIQYTNILNGESLT